MSSSCGTHSHFNRLPDKLSSNTTTALFSDIEEDEGESGAASENYSSADLTADYNAIFNPVVVCKGRGYNFTFWCHVAGDCLIVM